MDITFVTLLMRKFLLEKLIGEIMSNYKVTFWGTRGSIVQTSIDKMKYGLETSCISFETETEVFLIDCGSGARGFDKYFYENNVNKKINILLTHYHHDHIMGLGFVKFIYDNNNEVEIFGLGDVYENLKRFYGVPFFPVDIVDLPNIKTTCVQEYEKLVFGDLEIQTTLLEHPQMSLGYKFITKEKTVTFAIDYEYKIDPNKEIVEEFMKNSDYLIMDAFWTDADYERGWGHSTIEDAINLSKKLGIKECIVTHHNIDYNDDKLDELFEQFKKDFNRLSFAKANSSFEF